MIFPKNSGQPSCFLDEQGPRDNRLALGRFGEETAEAFLKKKGYRILERNVRTRFGEIDLVAVERGVICFIEVRTRRGDIEHMEALSSVGAAKQKKLSRLAVFFLKEKGWLSKRARFDVVCVGAKDRDHDIALVRNAFPVLERYR